MQIDKHNKLDRVGNDSTKKEKNNKNKQKIKRPRESDILDEEVATEGIDMGDRHGLNFSGVRAEEEVGEVGWVQGDGQEGKRSKKKSKNKGKNKERRQGMDF